MENASKALVIAGGMLIALLVLGALMLMFNQIGDYEKAQTVNEKNSQIAKFNEDFERYTYSDIQGIDVISIINKVCDYNKKDGIANSVNYDIKMSVTIQNLNGNQYTINKDSTSTGIQNVKDIINNNSALKTKKVISYQNSDYQDGQIQNLYFRFEN